MVSIVNCLFFLRLMSLKFCLPSPKTAWPPFKDTHLHLVLVQRGVFLLQDVVNGGEATSRTHCHVLFQTLKYISSLPNPIKRPKMATPQQES